MLVYPWALSLLKTYKCGQMPNYFFNKICVAVSDNSIRANYNILVAS